MAGVRNPPNFPCWLLEGIVHEEVNRVTAGSLTSLLSYSFTIRGKSHFNMAFGFLSQDKPHEYVHVVLENYNLFNLGMGLPWHFLLDHGPCERNGDMTKKPN